MDDLISRQAAIDALLGITAMRNTIPLDSAIFNIKKLPSAQPELPKQFMSDDCISRSELYKKVCEAEKLARERVLDTPSDSPFPNKLNPAYTRYSAQLDERTQFKHMIADARSVQPEQRWIPVSERLPYPWDERYLVSLAWGGIGVMEYKSTGFHNYGSFTPVPIESITAWMPLPEPYAERRTDESND